MKRRISLKSFSFVGHCSLWGHCPKIGLKLFFWIHQNPSFVYFYLRTSSTRCRLVTRRSCHTKFLIPPLSKGIGEGMNISSDNKFNLRFVLDIEFLSLFSPRLKLLIAFVGSFFLYCFIHSRFKLHLQFDYLFFLCGIWQSKKRTWINHGTTMACGSRQTLGTTFRFQAYSCHEIIK